MTKRTRLFMLIAVGILVAGLGTGLVASYMGLQGLAVISGNGPDELGYVPADARLVGYAAVREIASSELRQRFRELHPDAAPNGEIQQQTGINIETDVEHVVFAILGATGDNQRPLAIARGTFNETQIESVIREKGGTVEEYSGRRLLVLADDSPSSAVTFPEPGVAVFGAIDSVKRALDTRNGGQNVTGNDDLMRLVREAEGSNTWAVGRFDALTIDGRVPQNVLEQLPPINLFAFSGHITDGIRTTMRVEARDEAAAEDLREVIRGFIALARLQAGSNEQLRTLLNSVELAGAGTNVSLSVTIPAGLVDLIQRPPTQQQARAF